MPIISKNEIDASRISVELSESQEFPDEACCDFSMETSLL